MRECGEEQEKAAGTLHSAVDPLFPHQKLQPRGHSLPTAYYVFSSHIQIEGPFESPCFRPEDRKTCGREIFHTKQEESASYLSSHSPAAEGPVVTSQNGGLNKKKEYS